MEICWFHKEKSKKTAAPSEKFAPRSRGFSLVEMLVVVVVISVLAALGFAGLQSAISKSGEVSRINSMRQIGSAILSHVSDHRGQLPGPLWPGQIGYYDPARDGRLVGILRDYLAVVVPGEVKVFLPAGLTRAQNPAISPRDFRPYVMNMQDPQGNNPWGSLVAGSSDTTPRKVSTISSPASTWGFSEADQLHPSVTGASWRNFTLKEPAGRAGRLYWFFDGGVRHSSPAADQPEEI